MLVVGAGPAGLTAALDRRPGRAPASSLVDEQSEAGGSLLGSTEPHRRRPGARLGRRPPPPSWPATPTSCTCSAPPRSGTYDDGFVLALERRTDHLGDAARRHTCPGSGCGGSAHGTCVVATGAHERPVVFADNDRPGIMLAGAARTYLHRYGVLAGPRGRRVHHQRQRLRRGRRPAPTPGSRMHAVVDARPRRPAAWRAECDRRGIPVRTGQVVTGTEGVDAGHRAPWSAARRR